MRSVDEIIGKAREILSRKGVNLSILEGGTERGLTILRNREVLDSIGIKMRIIGDIEPNLSSRFLGRKISMPVMPAPLSGLVKSVDERCFHRIIKESWDAGVVPWIGYPIQDDVESFEQPFVWIIKPMKDRGKISQEIERAEKSNALAVGIDIDSAAGIKVGKSVIAYGGMKVLSKKELEDIASTTKLPFIVKGGSARRIITMHQASATLSSSLTMVVGLLIQRFHLLRYSQMLKRLLRQVSIVGSDMAAMYSRLLR